MTTEANTSIEILQVRNGFLVKPRTDWAKGDNTHPDTHLLVFQSFAELQAWLSEHFTHRESQVQTDAAAIRAVLVSGPQEGEKT